VSMMLRARKEIYYPVSFLILVFSIILTSTCFADTIQVPIPVYMEEFLKECKSMGLDLYGNRDSDGFVKDYASNFSVYTYTQAKEEQLKVITEAAWRSIRNIRITPDPEMDM
jgi:hypothetical protein